MKKIDLNTKTILITGASGFIGSNLVKRLCTKYKNIKVIGLDTNSNNKLKEYRLSILNTFSNFKFINCSVSDKDLLYKTFKENKPDIVVNLAGKAGYQNSNSDIYIENNVIGFYNILEASKDNDIKHILYASSASVYGDSNKLPFKEEDETNPIDMYGVSKKNNELMAHTYSKTYNIKTTGLRLFSVYGPMGNENMTYYEFTKRILNNEKISIYNNGNIKRDFIYIDDVIDMIIKMIEEPTKDIYEIYNIGNSITTSLKDLIEIISKELNIKFNNIEFIDKKVIPETYADITKLEKDYNYKQKTSLEEGIKEFIKWYKEYNK